MGLIAQYVGIDLGTSNTMVYVKRKGLVLSEPTIVVVDSGNERRVRAVGSDAKEMLGRTTEGVMAVRPLREGVITDYDITKIEKIKIACGENITIWTGNDNQILPAIANGCSGVISVVSNIYPELTNTICQYAMNGNFLYAAELQRNILPLIDLLFCEVNPIPLKAAMKLIGYDCGHCRLPLTDPTKAHLDKLEQYFSEKSFKQ